MALSDNAIGFFLEVEDVSLSRTLESATKSYEAYTKALDKYNKQAFDSASKGLGQIQSLVKAVEDLPTAAAKSMKRASATIEKHLKPISQKVDLTISAGSTTKLKRVIGQAVSEAISGANVRLSASLPQRRMAMFQQGVGLRAQYADVPQPPDMRGKIKPLKKFNKGGVVEGTPGIDKVFAMLTKGEMVLPADVTKKLASAGGRALKTGKLDPKDVKDLVDLTATYGDELKDVNEQFVFMQENLDQISDVTKLRLGSAMLQAIKRTEELEDVSTGAGNGLKRLLVDILGPAKFLAISKGIETVQEGINSMRAGAGAAFTTLGGDEIGSGIDSINRMNTALGLGRDELLQYKIRAGEVANEVDGITFDELGFALNEVAQLGVKGEEQIFALARASAAAAKGMNVATESVSAFGFELTGSLNVSQAGFEAVIGSISRMTDAESGLEATSGDLFGQLQSDVKTLNSSLRQLSDEESQRLLNSFNQIGATLSNTFFSQEGVAGIRDVMARAFEGGPENVDAIAQAAHLTGLGVEDLRMKLKEGDLAGIFDNIGKRVEGLSPDQLKALSAQIGISSDDLGKFGDGLDSINAGFVTAQSRIVSTGDGLAVLEQRASNNRTAWEKMQETFTDNVASMSFMGISGAEVLDFFKEFNLTALASVAILGKTALSSLTAAKGFLGLGGGVAQAGGTMASMGSMFTKLGPLLGKIAMTAGPLIIVAGAAALVTKKIIDLSDEVVAANAIANKGEKAALTDFGAVGADIMRVKKNIKRVQAQVDIDEASGGAVNENAIKLLERYNGQLADLEGTSRGMVDAAKARKAQGLGPELSADPLANVDLPQDFSFDPSTFQPAGGAAPVTAAEMAMLVPNPESNEKQEKLMERMVALMEEQVRATREGNTPANPSPTVQGPSVSVSSFGRDVAGGGL